MDSNSLRLLGDLYQSAVVCGPVAVSPLVRRAAMTIGNDSTTSTVDNRTVSDPFETSAMLDHAQHLRPAYFYDPCEHQYSADINAATNYQVLLQRLHSGRQHSRQHVTRLATTTVQGPFAMGTSRADMRTNFPLTVSLSVEAKQDVVFPATATLETSQSRPLRLPNEALLESLSSCSTGRMTLETRKSQPRDNVLLDSWRGTALTILQSLSGDDNLPGVKKVRKTVKKPKNAPKRALSAYNIFFKDERQRILHQCISSSNTSVGTTAHPSSKKGKKKPHGKISFTSLARAVAQKWQALDSNEVGYYKVQAEKDKQRYLDEMEAYLKKQQCFKVYHCRTDESTMPETFMDETNEALPVSNNNRKL